MDSYIIDLIPANLKIWASNLTNKDIAHILTTVGSVSLNKGGILSSANIGFEGEKEVEDILQERYRIINTAKSGKCGDFVITDNNTKILIEVKKYNKTVPFNEIEKFYRDIDSNSSINGAIMISLTSKIVGINKIMEYTNQYVNGNIVPVIFLSLKDINNKQLSKECICSAVDILLTESDSKNKCIDVGEGIINAVNEIDNNLDFLSQCRLMIHETQSMFNKQLGKLMQQVLSAEINIKKSVKVLKSKVDTIVLEDDCHSVQYVLSNLKVELEQDKYNLLSKILEDHTVTIAKKGNIIQTKDKKISINVTKSTIKVSILTKLTESLSIEDDWSYDGKIVTIVLNEKTINTIMNMIH
jgi:hypothetical protein